MKKQTINILGLFAFLVIGCTHPAHAYADEKSITISPPKVEYTVNPGDTIQGFTDVKNNSDEPLNFVLETQDFVVLDNKGTPTIVTPQLVGTNYPARFSAKTWINLAPQTFVLAPHAKQTISYSILVPQNASPGGHYAAIIYKPQSNSQTPNGAVVNTSVAELFSISVTGLIKETATAILSADYTFKESGPVHLNLTITNNGDNHIKPSGTISVYDTFGKLMQQSQIAQYNIFPTASRDYPLIFGGTWTVGHFTAKFLGTYGANNNLPLIATISFWIIPWRLLIILFFVIVAAILGILVLIKRKKEIIE